MASPGSNVVHGTVLGTTALITVATVGFRPKSVRLWAGGVEAYWQKTMADASAHKRLANGTGSLVTSNGITPLAGGFSIGTDSDINASAAVISYEVIGE